MKYLITGATGTVGSALVKKLIEKDEYDVEEVRVFSRDEFKQSEMARKITDKRVFYWLGDICNLERLKEACKDVDVIIHAAALKRMDTISINAATLAEVNIIGTRNVMIANSGKGRLVIFVSSDKAFQPSCLYGATKMAGEGIVLADPDAIVWRFGNIIGSRGSVWEIFKEQKAEGVPFTITDPDATRFVISVEEVCDYILSTTSPGLYYPENLKSMTVLDIAKSIDPNHPYVVTGLREGEKMDEAFNENYSSRK